MYIVVFYDVPAKRTRFYHKLLGRYLTWMQNSVFGGDLTEARYRKMRRDIGHVMEDDDKLAFVTTANRHNIEVEVVAGCSSSFDDSHQGSAVF